jgi:hypothetical protein
MNDICALTKEAQERCLFPLVVRTEEKGPTYETDKESSPDIKSALVLDISDSRPGYCKPLRLWYFIITS